MDINTINEYNYMLGVPIVSQAQSQQLTLFQAYNFDYNQREALPLPLSGEAITKTTWNNVISYDLSSQEVANESELLNKLQQVEKKLVQSNYIATSLYNKLVILTYNLNKNKINFKEHLNIDSLLKMFVAEKEYDITKHIEQLSKTDSVAGEQQITTLTGELTELRTAADNFIEKYKLITIAF